jgi:hypothetical protein
MVKKRNAHRVLVGKPEVKRREKYEREQAALKWSEPLRQIMSR